MRCQNLRYLAGRSPGQIELDRIGAAGRSREYRAQSQRGGWDVW